MVDAEGASVDLRSPRRDKFLQQTLQTIGLKRFSEDPGLHCRGTDGEGFSLGVIVISFRGVPET
jgi:ribosomal protein L5